MSAPPRPPRLPGDPTPAADIARIIRVDQAGEYGAVRIYAGQLAIIGSGRNRAEIRRMSEQEKRHLATFDALLSARRVRPTVLQPLWHVAGFALGAATALLGEQAAMACTVAVEDVIDEHYRQQDERIGDSDPELGRSIREARADEIAHREAALAHGAEAAPLYGLIDALVATGSRVAIWLSTRI